MILKNEFLTAEIADRGAELKRLTENDGGREIIWRGNEKIWSGSSPWLFPVVGRLREDRFEKDGRYYPMAMHGFALNSEFRSETVSDCRGIFHLEDTAETRSIYPWQFDMLVDYILNGRNLDICCKITGRNPEPMYFSLGAHPGFNCGEGDRLLFGAEESVRIFRLEKARHLTRNEPECLWQGNEMVLSPKLFQNGAMILENPASTRITLQRTNGERVTLRYDPVEYLGLWSMPGQMNYVCIEPWHGVDSPDGQGVQRLEEKPGIQTLRPGECFEMRLSVQTGSEGYDSGK